MVLERINGPEDLKGLTKEERDTLAREMRENLIQRASLHMGHVGPDLGFVEATIALHTVFDAPNDHLIFDVHTRPIRIRCSPAEERPIWIPSIMMM